MFSENTFRGFFNIIPNWIAKISTTTMNPALHIVSLIKHHSHEALCSKSIFASPLPSVNFLKGANNPRTGARSKARKTNKFLKDFSTVEYFPIKWLQRKANNKKLAGELDKGSVRLLHDGEFIKLKLKPNLQTNKIGVFQF